MAKLRAQDFTMVPHWGGVAGIVVNSLFKKYVFSHCVMRKFVESMLPRDAKGRCVLRRDLTVGLCDIQRTCYTELLFRKGTCVLSDTLSGGGNVIDYVVASGAIYGIFEGWSHADARYIDGGYAHNVPLHTIQKASPDSLLISIVPLDITNACTQGVGFWRFISCGNMVFFRALYSDVGRPPQARSTTAHSIVYDTPHGLLIGPRYERNYDFTLTYSSKLMHGLRERGAHAAAALFAEDIAPYAASPAGALARAPMGVVLLLLLGLLLLFALVRVLM
jgi:predicted acylesterase/phospholipase RssA